MVQKVTRIDDWKDLDLDFGLHPSTGDVSLIKGPNAISRSIRNLVLMHFYDKPFNPQVGSNATKLLFDNIGPLTAINLENLISEVIINYEPRAYLLGVKVQQVPDQNGYNAEVVFRVQNLVDPILTRIFLKRIR